MAPAQALLVSVGSSQTFRANASSADGARVLDPVVWSTSDPAVATIGQNGVATAVGAGSALVTATVGEASGSARLEVFVPEAVKSYEPGRSYWGRQGYVEYIPGCLPLVISAGHGGELAPREISNRTYGVILADRNTRELTMAVRDAFVEQTGFAPHIVISHLHRSKLDPNREIVEAAQDNIYAEHAWTEYHDLIRLARTEVELRFGRGLYLDMHGHSHPIQRIELGYLLNSETLNGSDRSLDALAVVERSSIRDLGRDSQLPFSALLRGPHSLGGLLEAEGVRSVPSPSEAAPGSEPYWRGGYSTRIHGSVMDGEVVSGIQLEHQWEDMRDDQSSHRAYAPKLARAVRAFMLDHYGFFEPLGG